MIKMYGLPTCSRCVVLKGKLRAKNIDFEYIDEPDVLIDMGFSSVPMLEVEGEVMDFTKAISWVNNTEAIPVVN